MRLSYRILFFFVLLFWCVGIFSEAFIYIYDSTVYLLPFIKGTYSIVCHQDTNKIIHFCGCESFVCARCVGIYIGLLCIAAISIFHKEIKIIGLRNLLLISLPMILDVFFSSIGFYKYSKYVAFITGFLFGSAVFSYFYNGLNDLLIELQTRK